MMVHPSVLVLLSLVLASPSPTASASSAASAVHREDVTIEGVPGRVERVQLEVPENPERQGGRHIVLTALVLRADTSVAEPDPMLVFQGGPGQSATELASFYAKFLAGVRKRRDIVLLDQRGTGQSHALVARVAPERMFDDLGAIVPRSWVAPALA